MTWPTSIAHLSAKNVDLAAGRDGGRVEAAPVRHARQLDGRRGVRVLRDRDEVGVAGRVVVLCRAQQLLSG